MVQAGHRALNDETAARPKTLASVSVPS